MKQIAVKQRAHGRFDPEQRAIEFRSKILPVRGNPSEAAPTQRNDVPRWRADIPPHPRAADDPQRRVTEMLARLARSAQA